MDNNGERFLNLECAFSKLSDTRLKKGIFVCPQTDEEQQIRGKLC